MIREQFCYILSIKSLSKNKVAFLYIISEFAVLQTQTWLIILAGQTLLTCPHPLPSMTLRHAAGKVVPLVPLSMGPIPLCPLNCYLPTPGLRSQSTSPYSSAQRNERQTVCRKSTIHTFSILDRVEGKGPRILCGTQNMSWKNTLKVKIWP